MNCLRPKSESSPIPRAQTSDVSGKQMQRGHSSLGLPRGVSGDLGGLRSAGSCGRGGQQQKKLVQQSRCSIASHVA